MVVRIVGVLLLLCLCYKIVEGIVFSELKFMLRKMEDKYFYE